METLRAARASNTGVDHLLPALALVLLAGLVHWGLRRLGRRVPVLLARRAAARHGVLVDPARLPWRRTIALGFLLAQATLWTAVAAYLSDVFPLLGQARELVWCGLQMSGTTALFSLNGRGYTVVDVLVLLALLGGLWGGVSALTHVVRRQVLDAPGPGRGGQEGLLTIARYVLVFVGAIVILQGWGVDVTSLTIGASVLGVGIGFGLQNIANNFVSGLLVNLERPIQPGDFVQLGELAGTVERIGGRSTEIRTLDRVTILVPNSRLLESEVINWTHGDPVSRLHVPVGVACGSNLATVRTALLDAAAAHPKVLADPRPSVEFRTWGESTLDLELLVWVREPQLQNRIKSDLHFLIETNFRRRGVEVPFPQRDLRVPALERAIAAWTRREFTAEELASPVNGVAPDDAMAAFCNELGEREWTADEVARLAERLRGPDGVPVLDRRYLFATYPRCFVGRELVDWLVRREGMTRHEAVACGQLLIDRGVAHHVLDEHTFKDGDLFYRFYADEDARRSAAHSG